MTLGLRAKRYLDSSLTSVKDLYVHDLIAQKKKRRKKKQKKIFGKAIGYILYQFTK